MLVFIGDLNLTDWTFNVGFGIGTNIGNYSGRYAVLIL